MTTMRKTASDVERSSAKDVLIEKLRYKPIRCKPVIQFPLACFKVMAQDAIFILSIYVDNFFTFDPSLFNEFEHDGRLSKKIFF